MRAVGQNGLPPAFDRQQRMHETVAGGSGLGGGGVAPRRGMVAENFEPLAIQLTEPALNEQLPDGVRAEEPLTMPILTGSSAAGGRGKTAAG